MVVVDMAPRVVVPAGLHLHTDGAHDVFLFHGVADSRSGPGDVKARPRQTVAARIVHRLHWREAGAGGVW